MPPADTDKENRWRNIQRFLNGVVTEAFSFPPGAAAGSLLKGDANGAASWGYAAANTKADSAKTGTYTDTLATTPGAGEYLISIVLNVTTAATAGTVAATLAFTDDVGAATPTLFSGFTLGATGRTEARYILRLASGSIAYTVTVTGVVGSPVFNVYTHATRLR